MQIKQRVKKGKIPSNLLIGNREILKSYKYAKKVMAELLLLKKQAQSKLPPLTLKKSVARNSKIAEAHPSCGRRQQLTELASTWPMLPQQGLHRCTKFQIIPYWLAGKNT